MKKLNLKLKLLSSIPTLALLFSVVVANSTCFFYTYQPKAPADLKNLRKF